MKTIASFFWAEDPDFPYDDRGVEIVIDPYGEDHEEGDLQFIVVPDMKEALYWAYQKATWCRPDSTVWFIPWYLRLIGWALYRAYLIRWRIRWQVRRVRRLLGLEKPNF